MRTINYQITKLQDRIYEQTLFHQLCSYYHLNNTQVFIILKLEHKNILFSSSFLGSSNQSNDRYSRETIKII